MTQDEKWFARYKEVMTFIETNKRNPSKHDDEERGQYLNWIKHNRKLYSADLLKEDRAEKFRVLMELAEKYARINICRREGYEEVANIQYFGKFYV